MSIIPCDSTPGLEQRIHQIAETLKTEAHRLGDHGLSEAEFYATGIFRAAIERIRGQFSATMQDKRQFVALVLNYMQDRGFIREWESAGEENRHDYTVQLNNSRTAVIELKGCLDGNNTNIFQRPPSAHEFVVWSVCSNAANDPRHNVWSGIHTRLSAEIIDQQKLVDGLIVWDWICGSVGRPCPKVSGDEERLTTIGQHRVPPPCLYLFPSTVPSARNNPNPESHTLESLGILHAFYSCFGVRDDEVNYVRFEVQMRGNNVTRTTSVRRGGQVQKESRPTAIRRS